MKTKLTFWIKASDKYPAMKKCIYSIDFEFYTPPETLGELMPVVFILIKYLALDSVPKHMINRSTMENYKNVIKKDPLLEWVITLLYELPPAFFFYFTLCFEHSYVLGTTHFLF